MQMQMQMGMRIIGGMPQRGGKPAKPPAGRSRHRERGSASSSGRGQRRYQVVDGDTDRPRYLGQASLGTNDIAGVKLFASNRNGPRP